MAWIFFQVWGLFHDGPHVKEMITQKIQEESLRTYLFSYSAIYDSMSLDTLAEMFDLEKSVVLAIISKMIINEDLMVSNLIGALVLWFERYSLFLQDGMCDALLRPKARANSECSKTINLQGDWQ